jgi:hypothetical protein
MPYSLPPSLVPYDTKFSCRLFCLLIHKKSCLKVSAHDSATSNEIAPIRVSPKPKQHKCLNNVFLDDHGFPDVSNEYNHVLHNIHGRPILRKLRHPKPDLSAPVDPLYYSQFILEKHKTIMKRDMDLSHLDPTLQ